MSKSDVVRQLAEEQGVELIDLPLIGAKTFNNQQEYDNATEPPLSDYQDDPMFAEFTEYVTLELLAGRDCMGIDSHIFVIDLEYMVGGYQMALGWVCERVTEKQYLEYKEEQSVEETS